MGTPSLHAGCSVNDTIDQFMWGFQGLFRIVVAQGIERALATIGLPVKPRVVLVGFALDDGLAHQVCVEPEGGPLTVDNLTAIAARTKELFEENPDSRVFHTDPRLHDLRRRQLFRRSRGDALVEAIEASSAFDGLTFFASNGAPIDGYHVHTCLGIPTAALDSLPALDDSVVDRVHVGRSLQHEVIAECLHRADRALYLPDPGADLSPLGMTEDIVRVAAARLAEGAAYRATNWPTGLFSLVNEFASLGYERTAAAGRLVIARREKTADRLYVRLQRPVPLRQSRSIRKLLELSDDSNAVLADHEGVYGLGACASALDVVEISVTDHAEWELSVDGSPLVRVSYGQATLPQPLLDADEFVDAARRILGHADIDRIWEIIQGIQGSGHGTTLVVSGEPEAETARLGAEAVPIEPRVFGDGRHRPLRSRRWGCSARARRSLPRLWRDSRRRGNRARGPSSGLPLQLGCSLSKHYG